MSFTIFQNDKTPFQAIKTRSSKSQKIDIFLKGLTHGYGPKMAIFPPFFNQYRQEKCVFKYFRMKNRIFRLQKTTFQKSQNCNFSIGVNAWFLSKNVHFSNFFQVIQARKMSFTIFENKKTHFQTIKTRSSKGKKSDVFPKLLTHGFGPKMAIFPTFVGEAILARKMSFTIFQNEKTRFQAIKTKSSKSQEIDIFPKGLSHGFGPKMSIFPPFFR